MYVYVVLQQENALPEKWKGRIFPCPNRLLEEHSQNKMCRI